MLLSNMHIKNFRCVGDVAFSLKNNNALIAENNSGKTSILQALDLCFSHELAIGENVFKPFDFHLDEETSEPAKSKPIDIKLTFQESEPGEWEEIGRNLEDAVFSDENKIKHINLKVSGSYDTASKSFKTEVQFLDQVGEAMSPLDEYLSLMDLHRMVAVYLISSLRDVVQEFHPESKLWGPTLRKVDFDEGKLDEIVEILKEANEGLLSGNESVKQIISRIAKLSEYVPLNSEDTVLVEFVPTRLFEVFSDARVNLASINGSQIPLENHGSGTQSIAVLILFESVVRSLMQNGTGGPFHPILAIEEPEAHLHSTAERAFAKMLPKIVGQKIVTTHSGRILSIFEFENIIRLCYKGKKLFSFQINKKLMEAGMTKREAKIMWRKLIFQLKRYNADWLFARIWLLVEGESEDILLPECAEAMGIDLSAKGVSVIKYSRLSLKFLVKLANQLGIEWFVLADNDQQGDNSVKAATAQLGDRQLEDHICQFENGSLEHFLCASGFGQIYEDSLRHQQKQKITADKSNGMEYWNQVVKALSSNDKLTCAEAVAEKVMEQGETAVPEKFKWIINQTVKLAQGEG